MISSRTLRMAVSLCVLCLVLDFTLMAQTPPTYNWHTFYGGSGHAGPSGTVVDASGNIYVTGLSTQSWNGPNGQAPLNSDGAIFVMKLDSNGVYQWHTFFGGSGTGTSSDGIAIDGTGNLYVSGQSTASWNGPPPNRQAPLNPFTASSGTSFVLKLDSNGAYQWHTFYPTNTDNLHVDQPDNAIALDGNGGIYLTGKSNATWKGPNGNLPLHAYPYHCPSGFVCNPDHTFDIFVLKLDSSGAYRWHTFYGSGTGAFGNPEGDFGLSVGTDSNNNVYVSAQSLSGTWNGPNGQLPLYGYPNSSPAVSVLKLNTNGAYQWHTFYGPSLVYTMAVTPGGNVYATGGATAGSWNGPGGQTPLNNYTSGEDNIFVLKLANTGAYGWHTFYPGSGEGIAFDNGGNVFATGPAFSAWNGPAGQLPLYPYDAMAGQLDNNILVLALNNSGTYQWHTFYPGSNGGDSENCNTTGTRNPGDCTLSVDAKGDLYIVGHTEMDYCCNGWNGPNGALPLHQDDGGTFVLQMKATGPLATPSPTALSFGNQVINTTSVARTVTLTNTGTGPLNIGSITISGSFAIYSKTCGTTLAVGAKCKEGVTFTPTVLGKLTGTLTFTDNAANSPQAVPLSGTGVPPAKLTPTSVTYTAQTVATTSTPKTFTLTNYQTVALNNIVISTTGDFAVSTTTCLTSLVAKGKCTISVVFTPKAIGKRTGQLTVSDSANNSPQTSSLVGSGK